MQPDIHPYPGSPQQLQKEVEGLIDQGVFLASDLPQCLRPTFSIYMVGRTFMGGPNEPVGVHSDDLYNFWRLVKLRDGLPYPIQFATQEEAVEKQPLTDAQRLDQAITELSRAYENGDAGDLADAAEQYMGQVLDAARKYQRLM